MASLIVFYSRTGTCKTVAEKLSRELKCDLEEIFDEKSRAGPLGWLSGGKDASQKSLTKIKPVKKDPQKYGLVIFGSPIWAGNVTPAIRTYITENKQKIRSAAFFCTMGGDNPSKFFMDAEEILGKKPKAILAARASELKMEKTAQAIADFVKKLK